MLGTSFSCGGALGYSEVGGEVEAVLIPWVVRCHLETCEVVLGMSVGKSQADSKTVKDTGVAPGGELGTVALEILEISLTSTSGMKKVLVTGDAFSRFMVAVSMKGESTAVIAEVLFTRWTTVLGPPLRLLFTRAKAVFADIIPELRARPGTKKIFSTL